MPRTQTPDHKQTHKERETKIYEVRQDAYVLGEEERDLLMIYIRLQEDYNWFSSELTQKSTLSKNGFTSSIYREKKKPP